MYSIFNSFPSLSYSPHPYSASWDHLPNKLHALEVPVLGTTVESQPCQDYFVSLKMSAVHVVWTKNCLLLKKEVKQVKMCCLNYAGIKWYATHTRHSIHLLKRRKTNRYILLPSEYNNHIKSKDFLGYLCSTENVINN